MFFLYFWCIFNLQSQEYINGCLSSERREYSHLIKWSNLKPNKTKHLLGDMQKFMKSSIISLDP